MKDLLSDVLLELHVPSFEVTKEFYGSLGYEVVWEKEPNNRDGYLVMRSGNSILNFYCGNEKVYKHSFFKKFDEETPRGYGVEIIIPVTGISAFYDKFKSTHPKNIVARLAKRFSHPDFRAIDPFGYYIRFVERYDWVNGRNKDGSIIGNENS